MTTERKITTRDICRLVLVKNKSFSNGQATVTKWHENKDSGKFEATISPSGGIYMDGEFVFQITAGAEYPEKAPHVGCKTALFHPNIHGEVCLNLLNELWTPDCGFEDVVQGLLFLFYNPIREDRVCGILSCPNNVTKECSECKVKISLEGGIREDYWFPPNLKYLQLCAREDGEAMLGRHDARPEIKGNESIAEVYFGIKRIITIPPVKDLVIREKDDEDCQIEEKVKEAITDNVGEHVNKESHPLQSTLHAPRCRVTGHENSSDEENEIDGCDGSARCTEEIMDAADIVDVEITGSDETMDGVKDVIREKNADSSNDHNSVNEQRCNADREQMIDLADTREYQQLVAELNEKNLLEFGKAVTWTKLIYGDEELTYFEDTG